MSPMGCHHEASVHCSGHPSNVQPEANVWEMGMGMENGDGDGNGSTSALASCVWGRCRFISSPSKSALYGLHAHGLKRKVRKGSTRAR